MSHPIILACLKLRGQWFAVKEAMEQCGMSHSTVRHRLEGLAVAGVLERRVVKQNLSFHVRKIERLCAIRDGQEPMPNSAENKGVVCAEDVTLPLAALLGYCVKRLPGKVTRYDREDEHNPDAKSIASPIHRFSSLEIV